jgi:succinate dehydrogenase / fumarate reductase cytochrome b subunit
MIYKPQLTSMMSIVHRITGASLAVGSFLVVWWITALATGPEYFSFVQRIMTSLPGQLVLFGFTVAVFYHLSNGIRHLCWDFGYNLSIQAVYRSGYMVLISTVIMTAVTWSLVLVR